MVNILELQSPLSFLFHLIEPKLIQMSGISLSPLNNNLHSKAYEGNYEIIKEEILQDNKLLTAVDDSGRQLLHWAAVGGHEELCSLLIEHGAIVDARDDSGWTPLIAAASAGRTLVVRLLIGRGADLNATNNGGHSALQYSASKDHVEDVFS
ncbi:26S proteasome non-ATPase regulatory subunit 10 [Armadillidium nasatum]|uniref:26S proteasome non-ATPase regulatory subunit 10 n=1 Tax=Armadillidium nasatum TaxID=96803 RepID=A0A5N5SIT1_9CRUS|nr:26S proteasome non-ATPase regulatory subunit 10 [Armadillidium nasatum]